MPSPTQAAAASKRNRALVDQAAAMVRQASQGKYTLPLTERVDMDKLQLAISGSSVELRMRVKSALAGAGCIA